MVAKRFYPMLMVVLLSLLMAACSSSTEETLLAKSEALLSALDGGCKGCS